MVLIEDFPGNRVNVSTRTHDTSRKVIGWLEDGLPLELLRAMWRETSLLGRLRILEHF
jgi:hypothetical protein